MTEPIACPECGEVDWHHTKSGNYSAEEWLYTAYAPGHDYDQMDIDTNQMDAMPWECRNGHELDPTNPDHDTIAEALDDRRSRI